VSFVVKSVVAAVFGVHADTDFFRARIRSKETRFMDCDLSEKILYKDECYAIQGAVFEVYREMGCGFLEPVYQECLERELSKRDIPFVAQKELTLIYKGEALKQIYVPDLVCFEKIIVELKSAKEIVDTHKAQLFNYLKATKMRLGLLVNFGHYPNVQIERIIL
jgi:GxxExxY protein